VEEKFLIRNLFNMNGVLILSKRLKTVYPPFDDEGFKLFIESRLGELSFNERSYLISEAIEKFLPDDFESTAQILLDSLPEPRSTELKELGAFMILPLSNFISRKGLNNFDTSINALFQMTLRCSAEFDIRHFIAKYPLETMKRLEILARNSDPAARRLATEGSRPRLPWGMRLHQFVIDPTPVLRILEILKDDPSLDVRRSVANNLNDISKDNPDLVVETLTRWKINATPEREWVINHSLRTLFKKGHKASLELQGFPPDINVALEDLSLSKNEIDFGEALNLSFNLINNGNSDAQLMVDFGIHFKKANGSNQLKVFKLSKRVLKPGETIKFSKKISVVPITTRVYYPGEHIVDVRVNGNLLGSVSFLLHPFQS
jgi:3-methyladenine DNA glycosylase AlkC